jgi:hypothetical protein
MGATASQASLVISQSSVRGLSEAAIWMALFVAGEDCCLEAVMNAAGANASAALVETAARSARERICMILKKYYRT